MFFKYFTVLIESLGSQAYHLYRCFASHRWIDDYFEQIKEMDDSDTELLLAIIAIQLHSGDTSPFYKMLESMESPKWNLEHLAKKMKQEVDIIHPVTLSGM